MTTIKFGIQEINYSDSELTELLEDFEFLKEALLIALNPANKKNYDFDFSHKECMEHAKKFYLDKTSYSKDLIIETFKDIKP